MLRSVTPRGHRVAVHWDQRRAVEGDEWDGGIVAGLLHSLVFVPLLSSGATAPLAGVPQDTSVEAGRGRATQPLGCPRLRGAESDREDCVLKVVHPSFAPEAIDPAPTSSSHTKCTKVFCVHVIQELIVAATVLGTKARESGTDYPPLVQVTRSNLPMQRRESARVQLGIPSWLSELAVRENNPAVRVGLCAA